MTHFHPSRPFAAVVAKGSFGHDGLKAFRRFRSTSTTRKATCCPPQCHRESRGSRRRSKNAPPCPQYDDADPRVGVERLEHGTQLLALGHCDDIERRAVEDHIGALPRGIDLEAEAVENIGEPGLPRRRELVRDARFQPSRQPQCKRDRARKAARGFRRRYRGQDPDHSGSIRPDVQGVKQVSKRLDYNQIAPEGLEALGGVHGYIAQSSLPATLVDLSTCASRRSTTAPTASTRTRVTC